MKSPVLVVLFILLVSVSGWLYSSRGDSQEDKNLLELGPISPVSQGPFLREVPQGAREFKSERYSFSLLYPEAMIVKEFDEGGGASSFTFEDIKGSQGFQIFIAPYSGSQVSPERFKQDIPSSIRKEPKDFQVDGVVATAFYSEDQLLGETREIWFIHEGYLFELTTLKLLENLLSEVVGTWQFIE